MRSVYVTTRTVDTQVHNYRIAPNHLVLDRGEKVLSVSEGTWKVTDLVSPETVVLMHNFKRQLEGIQTRR